MKIGDKVVCISDGKWWDPQGNESVGPKKDDILIITDICYRYGDYYLSFPEWRGEYYIMNCFRKLDYDFVAEVEKMVKEQNETIES